MDHVGINEEAFFGEYWRGVGRPARRRRPGGVGGRLLGPRPARASPTALGLGDNDDIQLAGIGRTP